MVQEFHVVRCFSCQSFQVQQVKKAKKWSCKMCGEKQSLQKEYGRGSGADCRRHVQKLNAIRGAMMEEQEGNAWSLWEQEEAEEQKQGDDQVRQVFLHQDPNILQDTQAKVSRWSRYLDTPEEAALEEEEEPDWNVLMDQQQLHGNNMTDRKRKRLEKTDSQEDRCTPDQPTFLKRKPGRPSATNSPPSQRVTSPPSQKVTSPPSQKVTSPPSWKVTSPPSRRVTSPPSWKVTSPPSQRVTSVSSGTASRCSRFLSTDCQVQVMKGSSVGGWSPCIDGATVKPRPDCVKPRPLLPVSSMFESGEEFSFDDDDFLTCQRV